MPPRPLASTRRRLLATGGSVATLAIAGCFSSIDEGEPDSTPDDDDSADGAADVTVDTVVDGLEHPWGLIALPGTDRLLVTERPGRLGIIDLADGTHRVVSGGPSVHARGQGGMLDVAVHPAYPDERWIYLTYAASNDAGSATALARGMLDADEAALSSLEVLFVAEPYLEGSAHYGSRVVVGPDDMLYVSVGDRQRRGFDEDHVSQDRSTAIGSTIRLTLEGAVPDDNPFVDDGAVEPAIWSYGHRNAQGMAVNPDTGSIWQSEHGQEDGDELNVIRRGGNYGWPIAHTGCEYGTEDPIGESPFDRSEIVDPVHHWPCTSGGFPPAGMTFYTGDAFPEWSGDLFVGNLAGRYLGRFNVDDQQVTERDPLLSGQGWRIRAVVPDPDSGGLLVAVDDDPAPIVRLAPAD